MGPPISRLGLSIAPQDRLYLLRSPGNCGLCRVPVENVLELRARFLLHAPPLRPGGRHAHLLTVFRRAAGLLALEGRPLLLDEPLEALPLSIGMASLVPAPLIRERVIPRLDRTHATLAPLDEEAPLRGGWLGEGLPEVPVL